MQRILVAIDLDEDASTVLGVAKAVAGGDAVYRVVHAFQRPAAAAFAGASGPLEPESALAILRKHAEAIERAEHKLLEGDPVAAIMEEARAWRADTIALAPHSKTRLERLLLGSTSERILRQAPINVLFARGPPRPLRRVLACTDLHAPSRSAAELASRVASRARGEISLLFAAHPAFWGARSTAPWPPDSIDMDADWLDRAQQEAIHDWLEKKVHEFNLAHLAGKAKEIVKEAVPQDAILEESPAYELVVVGTHGPTAYERAVVGSVAEAVASRAATSVLVAKGQRERL